MNKVKVRLQPIVLNINLTTVIKTTLFPGDQTEKLMIATQIGEIFSLSNGIIETFLDIRPLILTLGASSGGYDERGLLGLAFHPEFYNNGLFYLHYSMVGTQGPGAIPRSFHPNPCDLASLNLKWLNRETQFDHIDTVEEWILQSNGQPQKQRTLLNIRRPFLNHNGVNSLNFSPETGKLVLTTGDGGLGYDPFNLGQDNMEVAGKIIEIDVSTNIFYDDKLVVTRFDEIPEPIQNTLTVIAKGVRNITGIAYQSLPNQFIKCVGIVGQDLVEAVYSFIQYKPIPVTQITQAAAMNSIPEPAEFINFGWRGWEGILPTTIINECHNNETMNEKTIAYYDDALKTSVQRIQPLISYYHQDPRPDKFAGTALTGVQIYLGNQIPNLTGSVVFTDLANQNWQPPIGVLAYAHQRSDCEQSDSSVIDVDYDFGSQSAFFTCLGTNQDQTRLYLGVYGSMNVTSLNQGTIFEIVP